MKWIIKRLVTLKTKYGKTNTNEDMMNIKTPFQHRIQCANNKKKTLRRDLDSSLREINSTINKHTQNHREYY